MQAEKAVIGIGACLVGQAVRYNGESKRSNPHIELLSNHFSLRPFCPEVAIGLGVPRQTVRLVGELGAVSLRDSNTQSQDHTAPMLAYAEQVLAQHPELCGYILVKASPSCGYERVKRYGAKGVMNDSTGIFAGRLMEINPLLPVEEDGRLHDHRLRENFITRVMAYQRWQQLVASGISRNKLTDFWSCYKYQAMAHHIPGYQQLGRLLAGGSSLELTALADQFIALLMHTLRQLPSRKSHANVMQHVSGYLKKNLGSQDKRELDHVIMHYRTGSTPLVVPMTLLRHHFSHFPHPYIERQVFMQPYPEQLGLRNFI